MDWLEEAKALGASYLIIMYDPEDKEEYPVYLFNNQYLKKELAKLRLSEGKQKVIEVIKVL